MPFAVSAFFQPLPSLKFAIDCAELPHTAMPSDVTTKTPSLETGDRPGDSRSIPEFAGALNCMNARVSVCLTLLLVSVAVFYFACRERIPLHTCDTVYYLAGAKSLAEGTGYRMVLYDTNPRIGLYPPMHSAYLSCFWRINRDFPANQLLLYAAMVLLLLGCVALFFFGLRRSGFSLWTSAFVPLCLAVQPVTLSYINGLMSDLLFSLLAFTLALMWLVEARPGQQRWLLTGILLGLMFLTRTAAAPLLLGTTLVLGVSAMRSKTWLPFVKCVGPLACAVIFWWVLPKDTFTYGHYAHQTPDGAPLNHGVLRYLLQAGWRALDYNSNQMVACFSSGSAALFVAIFPDSAWWRRVCVGSVGMVALITVLIAVGGYWKHRNKTVQAIGCVWLLYCAQLVVWPYELGPRAIMPLLPFLCHGFILGIAKLPPQIGRLAQQTIAIVLAVGLLPSAFLAASFEPDPKRADEIKELALWTRENIPSAASVSTQADWFTSVFPMMHFVALSEHKLMDPKTAELSVRISKSDYMIFEGFPANRDFLELPDGTSAGKIVYRTPQNRFQILRSASPTDTGPESGLSHSGGNK
jgi:hypothetical protein